MRETKKCERPEVKAETKRKLSYQKVVMPKEDIRVQASNQLKPSITRTLARSPTADQGVKYRKDAKFFAPQATVLQHSVKYHAPSSSFATFLNSQQSY